MSVLVGKKAPVFQAKAVVNGQEIVENFSLEQFKGKQYVVFFFYPADFTFVCPTEIISFQEYHQEFEDRNTVVVAASTDSEFSHWKWLDTPQKQGGIQGVKYPIVADQSLDTCKRFVEYIIKVASGEKVNNEKKNYREIAIFKNGVTL